MELKQLQYFIAVAEQLNFSRAAETLYISQPRLSYQISELERELGVQLFIRDRRKVFLTPIGAAILPVARQMLSSSEEIRALALRGMPEIEKREPLSIGFDSTEDHFESTGVTELIAKFTLDYPDIELSMCQAPYDRLVRQLLLGELDLAFLVSRDGETLPPELNYKPVHRDRLVLVLPKDPKIHTCAEAMEKYALITVTDRPRGQMRIMRSLEKMGVTPRVLTVDSIPVSFTYVQAKKGAIFLPHNYFRQHHYDDLMTLDIPDQGAEILHVLAWKKSSLNSSIQLLVNSFHGVRDTI